MLLHNADFVITVDPSRRVLTGASLVIKDGRIADLGKTAEIEARWAGAFPADQIVDASGTLLAPGFVNSHVHTMEHLSRGLIPDNLATRPWVLQYFFPFQAGMTEAETYVGAKLACLDMARCGTTCFIDSSILNSQAHLDSVVQAVQDVGLRAVLGRGVCDKVPDDLPASYHPEWRQAIYSRSAEVAIAEVEAVLKPGTTRASGRIRVWATIFGLFTLCSDELFRAIKRLADAYGVGTNFHVASSLGEAEELEARAGVWPITQLDRLGALGPNVLLTHAIAVTDAELDILARHDCKIAHCPGAALRLAKGAARLGKFPEMLERGIVVSLGADGVCSCGTFDPTRLMFVAAGLFKDARMDATMIPAETALELATINGARALLWDDEIGSLEIGKKADIVQFDLNRPEWVPNHDVVRNLVYSADGGSVRRVFVDGREILRDRASTMIDEQKLLDEALEAADCVVRRTGLTPNSRWPRV
jgi:cytosine/adenosine deaminase-related metal-dependent hydrolase